MPAALPLSVAVIIPVRNYPAIRRCLESVVAQEYPRFEVIVVDDGSTDETPAVVREFDTVRLLQKKHGGAASARNFGARHTDAEVVFFLDSDTRVKPDCITRMVEPLQAEKTIGMTHGFYDVANPESLIARLIFYKCAFHFRDLDEMDFAWSFAIAIRRDVLEKVGLFDTYFPGAGSEDIDFAYRLCDAGYRIKLVREATVYHYFHDNLYRHLRRHLHQARLRMMLLNKTSRLTDQQIRPREYLNVATHGITLALLPLAVGAPGSFGPLWFALFVFCLCFHVPLTRWAMEETGDRQYLLFIPFEFVTILMWVFGALWGAGELLRDWWNGGPHTATRAGRSREKP